MCFKAPKPPAPTQEQLNQEAALKRQTGMAREDERIRRTMDKEARKEDALALFGGSLGRRSLLTGGKGGIGYPSSDMRSLLS
jgi:hypothetical protein